MAAIAASRDERSKAMHDGGERDSHERAAGHPSEYSRGTTEETALRVAAVEDAARAWIPIEGAIARCASIGWSHAAASATPSVGELALIAERLVGAFRVGRVGRDGHRVRLELVRGGSAWLEIEMTHAADALNATITNASGDMAEARAIADALARALEQRGIDVDGIDVR